MAYVGWLFLGTLLGAVVVAGLSSKLGGFNFGNGSSKRWTNSIWWLLTSHFQPTPLSELTISEREFPYRVRADLQKTVDKLFGQDVKLLLFTGVRKEYAHEAIGITDCLFEDQNYPTLSTPAEYEEIDIGEEEAVRAPKKGLWLLEQSGCRFAVMMTPSERYGHVTGLRFQVATPNTPEGTQVSQAFYRHLEESVLVADSYRGKILSLEKPEHYLGQSEGITVHRLRRVDRDQVILPEATLSSLERNVIRFVQQRGELSRLGQATKKGVLFYGPPGTGKTHTIHYLTHALPGHTTLLISAEQVGLLDDYMSLARLLQPSIVVLEDVDLIARNREQMDSVCEEVLLNKLLNEMDGLKQEADILFILTTNRPEALEAALASRPGRVDQAIEFPLPDDDGRKKLLGLYAASLSIPDEVLTDVIRRTEGVSAAFIKELVRRAVQISLEDGSGEQMTVKAFEGALDEMLFHGGLLNLKILGAESSVSATT